MSDLLPSPSYPAPRNGPARAPGRCRRSQRSGGGGWAPRAPGHAPDIGTFTGHPGDALPRPAGIGTRESPHCPGSAHWRCPAASLDKRDGLGLVQGSEPCDQALSEERIAGPRLCFFVLGAMVVGGEGRRRGDGRDTVLALYTG